MASNKSRPQQVYLVRFGHRTTISEVDCASVRDAASGYAPEPKKPQRNVSFFFLFFFFFLPFFFFPPSVGKPANVLAPACSGTDDFWHFTAYVPRPLVETLCHPCYLYPGENVPGENFMWCNCTTTDKNVVDNRLGINLGKSLGVLLSTR